MLRWLLRNTRNSRDHLTPELALRLITPQCPLYVAQPRALPVTDPYWAFYWPGGQGLTRYILDNPSAVAGRRVLDFGCGCGAASVASTLAGAEKITAVDIDAVCFLALWINYRINKVVMNNDLRFCNFNLLAEGASELSARISAEHDVILLGDMLYDTDFGASVSSWLRTCRADSTIYISDPGRHVLKAPGSLQSALKPCASYPLPFSVICENPGFSSVVIYEVDFFLLISAIIMCDILRGLREIPIVSWLIPEEVEDKPDRKRPCDGIRADLRECVLTSDCVLLHNRNPKECFSTSDDTIGKRCKDLSRLLGTCKMSLLDPRTRFRGRSGY